MIGPHLQALVTQIYGGRGRLTEVVNHWVCSETYSCTVNHAHSHYSTVKHVFRSNMKLT